MSWIARAVENDNRGSCQQAWKRGDTLHRVLEARVTSLHHEQHLGFKRLCQIGDEVLGFQLSAGGAVSIGERAGRAAESEAEAMGEQVRQSQVIGSDETSARVHGRNYWQWVFVGGHPEYHVIVPSQPRV